MNSNNDLPAGLVQFPVVGILRGFEPAATVRTVEAAWRAGLKMVEVTLNSPAAHATIGTLRDSSARSGDAMVGAGTVTSVAEASGAVDAGAQFLVTPIADVGIVEWAVNQGIPVFPGAFSPTEVFYLWQAGATAVKVFPASVLGVEYISSLRGPLPQVPLLPTGGIGIDNAAAYLAAGAVALGVGSPLFTKEMLADDSGRIATEVIGRWRKVVQPGSD